MPKKRSNDAVRLMSEICFEKKKKSAGFAIWASCEKSQGFAVDVSFLKINLTL